MHFISLISIIFIKTLVNYRKGCYTERINILTKNGGADVGDEILTVKQTAEYLKVSDRSVHKLIADKKLLASKVGMRSWRIKKSDIDTFLQSNTNFSEGEADHGDNI